MKIIEALALSVPYIHLALKEKGNRGCRREGKLANV